MGGEGGGAEGVGGIAFDLFAMCHSKPYLQFHGFVPNQVILVVVLQILSIMGGGVEENTLTWPSQRYSPWLIYLQNEKL